MLKPLPLAALALVVAASGCAMDQPGRSAPAGGEKAETSQLGPYGGRRLADDDDPGELYKDDDIYDDDVGVLDYYIIPPGL